MDANPPATIQWIKNLNTDSEEVVGESRHECHECHVTRVTRHVCRHGARHPDQHGEERQRRDVQLRGDQQRGHLRPVTALYRYRGLLHDNKTSAANRSIGSTTGCTITEKAPKGLLLAESAY